MAMEYEHQFIPPDAVPRARLPLLQHLLDTYASETSKTAGVWSELTDSQLDALTKAAFTITPTSRSEQYRAPDPGASDPVRAPLLRGVHRSGRAAGRNPASAG